MGEAKNSFICLIKLFLFTLLKYGVEEYLTG